MDIGQNERKFTNILCTQNNAWGSEIDWETGPMSVVRCSEIFIFDLVQSS